MRDKQYYVEYRARNRDKLRAYNRQRMADKRSGMSIKAVVNNTSDVYDNPKESHLVTQFKPTLSLNKCMVPGCLDRGNAVSYDGCNLRLCSTHALDRNLLNSLVQSLV